MRSITTLVIHCSATEEGDVDSIRKYHTHNLGWSDIGYHYVILKDGTLQAGRPLDQAGAHVRGRNQDTIGICLIGEKEFTPIQFHALTSIIGTLRNIFGDLKVLPHHVFPSAKAQGKTCPNEQYWPVDPKSIFTDY